MAGDTQRMPQMDSQSLPSPSTGGGWVGQHEIAAATCEIDVRTTIEADEFLERYVRASRPVLLPLNLVAATDWVFWGRASLVREAGECELPVVRTRDVVSVQDASRPRGPATPAPQAKPLRDLVLERMVPCADDGPWPCMEDGCPAASLDCAALASLGLCNGHEFGDVFATPPEGLRTEQIALRCPVACGACQPRQDDAHPPHEEDDGGGGGEELDPPYVVATRPSGPRAAAAPAQLRGCWEVFDRALNLSGPLAVAPDDFLPPHQHKRIFFAGPARSGSAFHDHSNAFNLLPYGSKRWLLLPPSGTYALPRGDDAGDAAAAAETPGAWLQRYDALRRNATRAPLRIPPLQCTQPAGSALFVPSGWKHAIVNAAPSVGVAVEVGDLDVMRRAAACRG